MPVFPDVASRISLPAVSSPEAIPSWIIRSAGRSFTEPPGFFHSAFAYNSTPGISRSIFRKRMSGVSPTRSTMEGVTLAVNVGIAMSDYKGLTLPYPVAHAGRLQGGAPPSDAYRSKTRGHHQARRTL